MHHVKDYLKGLGIRRIDLSVSQTKLGEISQKLTQGMSKFHNYVWMCPRVLRVPCERAPHFYTEHEVSINA